jgi:beta propeller repeat protein
MKKIIAIVTVSMLFLVTMIGIVQGAPPLGTPQEKQITTNTANQINPAISGNRIVWQDYRNGNSG